MRDWQLNDWVRVQGKGKRLPTVYGYIEHIDRQTQRAYVNRCTLDSIWVDVFELQPATLDMRSEAEDAAYRAELRAAIRAMVS